LKNHLKYFILLAFCAACRNGAKPLSDEISPLYSSPVVVAFDTTKGYSINLITGDSIKPLLNSTGDTLKTGSSFSIQPAFADAEKIAAPAISHFITHPKKNIETNIHPVSQNPETISGEIIDLKKTNAIVNTGIVLNIKGETKLLHEPKPIKTLPLRFKDNASSNIQYLEVGQGLSYPFVHAILIDKKGYIWFGLVGNGLCKYDGISITNYTQKDGLPDNDVTSLIEDNNGNILIGTINGLGIFDGKKITCLTTKNGFPGNLIDNINKDKKNNIWLSSSEIGYIMYDGEKFIHYPNKATNTITPFFEDSHGTLWYETKTGLGKFTENQFINYPIKLTENGSNGLRMIEDKKGDLWVASAWYGFFKYDGNSFIRFSDKDGLSDNTLTTLNEDNSGNIWIGTRFDGINKFDGKNITTYQIEDGLTNNAINCAVADNDGNIWCGTDGGGINKLRDGFKEVVKMDNLGNRRIRPIMKDSAGSLWFGTETGKIFKYDGKTIENYINPNALPLEGVRAMLPDRKGNLWFGYTDNGGLYKFDKKKLTHYTTASGIRGIYIMSIVEDRHGSIWLGTFKGGIHRLQGNTFSYYSESENFPAQNILTILEDKKGNLWFGTKGYGVIKYDGNNFITFSEKEGLFGRDVTSIVEDGAGNLWFGTIGAGLCRFDGKSFTYYTEKQGLSFNDVWSLKEDLTGQFWVGTDKGLSLLTPIKDATKKTTANYAVYKFALQDGLKGTDFNLHSVCIDNDNRIWWGNGKALITRDLNIPFTRTVPKSLGLNRIEINGKFYDFRSIADSGKKKSISNVLPFTNYPQNPVLSYNESHLSFHFSAIDWSAPEKIKYSYRMSGLDKKWSSPSEETMVDYRNLNHGKYKFQVKAIGQSQVWTEPFTYSFTILPAWWQTWWFRALTTIVLLTVAFFICRFMYFYQLRKQRATLEKQLAVQFERQRISAEMHDDIGAGLSGIRLLTEMTKNKVKDEQTAEEINKIYQSVGDISSKMKEVIWSLNTENDNLPNLVAYIQKQARLSLENYPCHLAVEIPEKITDVEIDGETRRNIVMIVKEAIHNIIKHSGADKVNLTINSSHRQLTITIADNGKGIINTQNNTAGNGMKNMRTRIEKLKGKLFIQNKEGLTLIFEIPLKEMA